MAQIDVTRSYRDGEVLTEADLDAFLDDIETFLNVTKINDDNIQNSGITGSTKLLNTSVTAAKLATDSVTTLKIADQNVTTAKIADEAVSLDKLAEAVINKLVPTGTIIAYGDEAAPDGWLYCDGSAVSRTTYSTLFGVIGVKFGYGNNSTTFNLPDLRGRFLRGFDDGTGVDPDTILRTAMNTGGATGDAIGSIQPHATALPANTGFTTATDGSHTHNYDDDRASINLSGIAGGGGVNVSGTSTNVGKTTGTTGSAHSHAITLGGDNETRPKNAAVAFMIKI